MSKNAKFAIIGAGAMGEAILAGLLRQKLAEPKQIFASEPRKERCTELNQKYGIQTTTKNLEAIQDASIVILAVKPQRLEKVMSEVKNQIPQDAVVVSIVAGAAVDSIKAGLNHPYIIRTMPNTPGQIGEGITVWYAAPEVTETQSTATQSMLEALGKEIQVEEEYYLDMATAVSGTGPMYVFLFMEAMMDAAVHLGFSRHIAEQLVTQTIRGSVDYYESQPRHVADLRNKVTSPGGTSAAALYYLEKSGFRTAISRSIWAAYERSQQLGQGKRDQHPEKNNGNE